MDLFGYEGRRSSFQKIEKEVCGFRQFGKTTRCMRLCVPGQGTQSWMNAYVNEFWTSKQRAAHSLHEVSYRACFKPQLPRFFIERLTRPGDVVYDPFMGRGTTLLEAALMNRVPAGCDINPLSRILVEPRLSPPALCDVQKRLEQIDFSQSHQCPKDLLVFYHKDTLNHLCALRHYFLDNEKHRGLDSIDKWIRMTAVNRLTGHSPGFFSVYTLPPNQAVSVQSQRKINAQRKQKPVFRDVPKLILKKTRSLLSDCQPRLCRNLSDISRDSVLLCESADKTRQIKSSSVSLVVTSPPFLDVVDYAADNWLRAWFCGVDVKKVKMTVPGKLALWEKSMARVFVELARVLKPDGFVAFEVGEVRAGLIKLEESVVRCGLGAGLTPLFVLINDQKFTKTANCWGVDNNTKGTNTNRIVLFKK